MSTSIYLSNNIIRIIVGAGSGKNIEIKKEITRNIPEGSLINGVITNHQDLEEELRTIWKEEQLAVKDVFLVVHSSKFVSKQLTLAGGSKKQLEQMLPLEFSDVERYEEAVYDYMLMPKTKSGNKNVEELLGVMAERNFVTEYIELFQRLGIKLSGIINGIGAAVKSLENLKQLNRRSCIVQVVDGANLESILWVEGEYKYSMNRRVFAAPGSREFGTEVIRHTNSVLQFYGSMKMDIPITEMLVCGATANEIQLFREISDEAEMNLQIHPLDVASEVKGTGKTEKLADYIYPYGALIPRKKDINLLNTYKKNRESISKEREKMRLMLPGIVALIICLIGVGIGGVIYGVNSYKYNQVAEYTTDPSNRAKSDEVIELESKLAVIASKENEMNLTKEMISSYPLLNQSVVHTILSKNTGDISGQIVGYLAEEGKLTLDVKAKQITAVNGYVTALKNTNLFSTIEYSGYTYMESDNEYTMSISCYLTERGEE